MPKFDTYPEDSITTSDKVLFFKSSATAVKSITFTNLVTAIRTALASFFTSSTIVPSAVPTSGQMMIGNGTSYGKFTIGGDASVSAGGILTIANGAVSYGKMQDVSAASRLLGRGQGSGSGSPVEITLGTGLSMTGNQINVTAGNGNVTQSTNATEANHVFVSGGGDKSRVETPVEIDPGTGDVDIPGDLGVQSLTTPEIAISATHATDDTVHGVTISDIDAGGTIAQWDLVYLDSSGEWQVADADGSGTFPARGIAAEAGTSGNPMKVLVLGSARNDAWAFTPGGDLFMSATAGGLTQTAPAVSGDEVQKVGYALSADKAFFNFGFETVTIA